MGDFLTEYERLTLPTSDEGRRYRFALTFPNGKVLYGVMLNELAFGGGNQFSSTGAILREVPILGNALALKDKINPGLKLAGRSAFSKAESQMVWEESNKPNFTLEFILLAMTNAESIDNLDKISLIESAVLPSDDGGGLVAPLGYSTKGSGTLNLTVGAWFNARGLVVSSSSCTPSRAVMKDGNPMSWNVTITLEPYRTVTIGEFKKYFQKAQILDMDEAAEAKREDPNLFDKFVSKVNDIKKDILG